MGVSINGGTSYSGRTLSLSSRTVNETAAVLELINGS
jgi:hypothetical protein